MVVRDVAGEGGEADVRREREHGAVRGEAVGPFIPCTRERIKISTRSSRNKLERKGREREGGGATHRPCTGPSR